MADELTGAAGSGRRADPESDADSSGIYDEAYVAALRSEAEGYLRRIGELDAAEAARALEETGEVEALKARLAEAEQRAKALEVAGIRSAAAAAHGVPEDLREFITADDEAGALVQAEKLAAGLNAGAGQHPEGTRSLPQAGGRNPAGGGEQAARLDEKQRFEEMRQKVPALNSRVLRQ